MRELIVNPSSYARGKEISTVEHYWGGYVLNIIFLPITWSRPHTTPQERYATVMGFGTTLFVAGAELLYALSKRE